MKNTIFITGVGRSGTTLLQSVLNAHSKIDFPPETHFIKNYVVEEIKNKKYSEKKIPEIVADLKLDKNILFDDEYLDKLKDIDTKDSVDLLSGFIYFELFGQNKLGTYLGDKDPMNINYLQFIYSAFPNSKILHIIRDPRDVIASRIKSDWGRNKSVLWHASEYKYSIEKGKNDGLKYFGENYIEITYENLVTDPNIEIRRISDFLGLDMESDMLNPHLQAKKLIREDELEWKKNVLNPIDPSNIGHWKSTLTKEQIDVVESILKNTILRLGYEFDENSKTQLSLFTRLRSFVIEGMFKLKFGV